AGFRSVCRARQTGNPEDGAPAVHQNGATVALTGREASFGEELLQFLRSIGQADPVAGDAPPEEEGEGESTLVERLHPEPSRLAGSTPDHTKGRPWKVDRSTSLAGTLDADGASGFLPGAGEHQAT